MRDRVPEVMRIKEGANYILMELGPNRETHIEYTVECPLRGFYSIGPVTVRIQDGNQIFKGNGSALDVLMASAKAYLEAVNKMIHWNFKEEVASDVDVMEKYSVNPPNVYGFGHKEYYDHVVDAINNNKSQLVDGLQGRKSLELISAIYESVETGKEVFLRFKPEKCRLGEVN